MANEITEQKKLLGECSFCKSQVEKKKMTQHLKSCKQRLETIAAEMNSTALAAGKATTFYHLLVEGRYNPQYWMHIDMPSSDELYDLDAFLRDIWVECCDHLSGFKIGEVNYANERGDYFYFGEAEDEKGEEGVEEEEVKGDEIDMAAVLEELPSDVVEILTPEFLETFIKARDADEAVKLLRAELKAMPKDTYPRNREERVEFQKHLDEYRRTYLKKGALNMMIDMLEDRSLYQPLEKLLTVGQSFTYEYDYGSTTYLKLKVVAKREGVINSETDRINVLARNLPPEIKCNICGKPATKVVSGYYNLEEQAYCNKCAKKSEEDEYMLPVVNSPRMGVCGYTG